MSAFLSALRINSRGIPVGSIQTIQFLGSSFRNVSGVERLPRIDEEPDGRSFLWNKTKNDVQQYLEKNDVHS